MTGDKESTAESSESFTVAFKQCLFPDKKDAVLENFRNFYSSDI
jgi:hypothetical protein